MFRGVLVRKKAAVFGLVFSVSVLAFSDDRAGVLLSGYLANDLELQKCALTAQSKLLDWDSAKVENGITLNLSTGTVRIQASAGGTSYTFSPAAEIAVPRLRSAAISAVLPMTKANGFDDDSRNGLFLDDGTVKFSAEITDSSARSRNISLLEAERAYIEAERSAQNRAVAAEKEFYGHIKSLYEAASDIFSKKTDVHTDEIELDVLETQGYSRSSSLYRSKQLAVQTGKRNIAEAQRNLERETVVFAMKCGAEFYRSYKNEHSGSSENDVPETGTRFGDEDTAVRNVLDFLPADIPSVELDDILRYKNADYAPAEEASWNVHVARLKAESVRRPKLSAFAGYTFNESLSGFDTVDGGLSFSWNGLAAEAGISVPTGGNALSFDSSHSGTDSKHPVYTFSLSFSPETWKLASIEKKQSELALKISEVALKSAFDDYETDVLDKISSRADLQWSETVCAEEYNMYSVLEADSGRWLAQGIITESDYLDALNNKLRARLSILINAVEQIIYNDDIQLLFVENQKKPAGQTEKSGNREKK